MFLASSNIGTSNIPPPTNDDFFSTFLGNNPKPPSPKIERKQTQEVNETSFSNWNTWSENNNTSQIVRETFIFLVLCRYLMSFIFSIKNIDSFRITVRQYNN